MVFDSFCFWSASSFMLNNSPWNWSAPYIKHSEPSIKHSEPFRFQIRTFFLKPKQASSSMAESSSSINPTTGFFCKRTKTYHSERPTPPLLPPPTLPLSITAYIFSLLPPRLLSSSAVVDAASGGALSFSDVISSSRALASSLSSLTGITKGQTALILSPSSLNLSLLYLSLLSLGVVLSPANPLSSPSDLSHIIRLSQPSLVFASRAAAAALPHSLRASVLLLDSPEFQSLIAAADGGGDGEIGAVEQSDTAAILYSSGTTGMIKGVALSHRSFIVLIAGLVDGGGDGGGGGAWGRSVSLFTVPLFHILGLFLLLREVARGSTAVLMERFDFVEMLAAVERYRVTFLPAAPPLVAALGRMEVVEKYDLSSLVSVGCGGAPLSRVACERFFSRFPSVDLVQGYGMTETCGAATAMMGAEECKRYGSAGKLAASMEAMIVDPATGTALAPGQRGELWLRGPLVMKGYVGDEDATSSTMTAEGWLKTGDLCYFDSDGFLFIVDRLKELIKYKAYQVPPAELEHLLHSNPEIADAAVVPYEDEEAGEIPMAFVVRARGSHITEAQVMDFVSKQVAPYKKIRRVAFVTSIPRSAAGKILRRHLLPALYSKI